MSGNFGPPPGARNVPWMELASKASRARSGLYCLNYVMAACGGLNIFLLRQLCGRLGCQTRRMGSAQSTVGVIGRATDSLGHD